MTATVSLETGEVSPVPGYLIEEQLLESPELEKFLPALIKAKQSFEPVVKEATNPAFHSNYEDLGMLLAAVEPALLANGIVPMHQTRPTTDGKHIVFTRLMHTSGQWMGSLWKLTPTRSDPQGEGSAYTYARRYQLKGLLSIRTEDDDANAASAPARQQRAPQRSPQQNNRNWEEEAKQLLLLAEPPEEIRVRLLQLMEQCERANKMTPALNKRFIEMGKTIKARIEAAAEAPAARAGS
jgi:hypothetical protein